MLFVCRIHNTSVLSIIIRKMNLSYFGQSDIHGVAILMHSGLTVMLNICLFEMVFWLGKGLLVQDPELDVQSNYYARQRFHSSK